MFRIVTHTPSQELALTNCTYDSIEENPCMLLLRWILGFPFLLPSMGIGYLHGIAGINRDVRIVFFEERVCCVHLTGIMLTQKYIWAAFGADACHILLATFPVSSRLGLQLAVRLIQL
jgi:hypothetical protein